MNRRRRAALLALGLALAGLAAVLAHIWWLSWLLVILACWALAKEARRD
jgi:hypothetical protein